jgi:hypothetical protein
MKGKAKIYRPGQALRFQEVEATKFPDSQQIKVVRFSALCTGRFYPRRKYSWYLFLLEADSTPGQYCDRKDYVNETSHRTRTRGFRLVAQCLNQLRHRVPHSV